VTQRLPLFPWRRFAVFSGGAAVKKDEAGPAGIGGFGVMAKDPERRGAGARGLMRQILVSQYFVLYLTVVYFVAMAVFFPDLVTARNISNQLSNVWPLFAVAIGQTFVIIIMDRLSQGAIMGFASVAGAV
jgi:hypothetical protein